mmetsp:Transcript_55010/g.146717  ORF Transcript_55010/g.146717 Transcript_55010/m.146717 type:complete len:321 (+) Transcript_55010:1563-2525(+)
MHLRARHHRPHRQDLRGGRRGPRPGGRQFGQELRSQRPHHARGLFSPAPDHGAEHGRQEHLHPVDGPHRAAEPGGMLRALPARRAATLRRGHVPGGRFRHAAAGHLHLHGRDARGGLHPQHRHPALAGDRGRAGPWHLDVRWVRHRVGDRETPGGGDALLYALRHPLPRAGRPGAGAARGPQPARHGGGGCRQWPAHVPLRHPGGRRGPELRRPRRRARWVPRARGGKGPAARPGVRGRQQLRPRGEEAVRGRGGRRGPGVQPSLRGGRGRVREEGHGEAACAAGDAAGARFALGAAGGAQCSTACTAAAASAEGKPVPP